MNVTLNPRSKLNMLEEAGEESRRRIANMLKVNPIPVIVGDNLDFRVKTGQQTSERGHKSCHYFSSLLVFPRIATTDISNQRPPPKDPSAFPTSEFLLNDTERLALYSSYSIFIARSLAKRLSFFSFLKPVIPEHIRHQFSLQMCQKSTVLPLPMTFKNEAKLDDCVDILGHYVTIMEDHHLNAFGNTERLKNFRTPVFGDQLTRVRLQAAKRLRGLAVKGRFAPLGPMSIVQWHNKQDFLEKAYKTLFKPESKRVKGTLRYFKDVLHRSDVNGKVKTNYRAHEDLLLAVGECLLIEQLMTFFGMESEEDHPQRNVPDTVTTMNPNELSNWVSDVLCRFLVQFGYLQPVSPGGIKNESQDDLNRYSSNLTQWYLQLLSMNDVAKEGDTTRLIYNSKAVLPFFYSHSVLSKYFVENIDFLLKTQHTLSPLESLLLLECSFVNTKGSCGENKEIDLAMENSVCNRKGLIKHLGANKTHQAITRCTDAADAVASVSSSMNRELNIPSTRSRHTKVTSEDDIVKIAKVLREIRPFQEVPTRNCRGLNIVRGVPWAAVDARLLESDIENILTRLLLGQNAADDDDDDDSDDDYQSDDDNNWPCV